ncbi:3'-5' exonuclease [Rhizobium nepotum]|uniref:3'-5' exonuclease n=1 Tax=Rhizobium nepotum TaxID=1035271 RepID=UPI003CEFCF8A
MPMNLMVDIETFGNRMDSAILTIGAVFFDPDTGEIGGEFYTAIDPDSACRYGRVTGSTVAWWLEQSEAARRAVVAGKTQLPEALAKLADFYAKHPKAPIWGNGPTFDISILEHAYWRVHDKPAPWAFWNVRDCRTIKDLGDAIGYRIPKLEGTAHNALDDARHQAMWVIEIRRLLLKKPASSMATVAHKAVAQSSDFDDI